MAYVGITYKGISDVYVKKLKKHWLVIIIGLLFMMAIAGTFMLAVTL